MTLRSLTGRLVGSRLGRTGLTDGAVLHLNGTRQPGEPAENAFVFVDLSNYHQARARYLAWVNLFDIEHAAAQELGRWSLAEPSHDAAFEVEWRPFGWGGPPFPSVADMISTTTPQET